MEVIDVLWSSDSSRRGAPHNFTTPEMGWRQSADDNQIEEALHGSSRLEVGEEYVIALAWKRAECDTNDFYPARWSAIGSGGILSLEDGVVGFGEFEGRHHDADERMVVGPPLAHEFAKKKPEALIAPLHAAPATDRPKLEGGNTIDCPQTGAQKG